MEVCKYNICIDTSRNKSLSLCLSWNMCIYISISRFIIYLYDKAGFVLQGGGVPFSFYSGVAALYVRICLLLWWLMVTELPLQILPWEDAYPLHVHILGMVGLPKKKTHKYCKTPSTHKLRKTWSNEKLWIIFCKILSFSRFFFGGAVWCGVYVVAFNQSLNGTPEASMSGPMAGEALLEWWTFECLEPKARGFGQRIWNSSAGVAFYMGSYIF